MSTAPNVVLILVDDLGWTDLTCYDSRFYETPNIDALAETGVRFTNAYAASPVCSPSRASLMTGKYPARVGITDWIGGQGVGQLSDVPYFHGLPENEYSLARAFGDGGYRTWHVGKWHLGEGSSSPEAHGFDVNIGGCDIGSPSSYFSPYAIPTLPDGPQGEYLTTRLTDEAVELINNHDQSRPFFLNLWHYTVHMPAQAPEGLVQKYRNKAERLGLPIDAIEPGEDMTAWHLAGRRVMRRTLQSDPTYAAMVETLDDSVGAVVEALRDTGQLENTVIVLTSDNGGLSTAEGSPTCNAPLSEGKGWMVDGGVRVPLIVSYPGVAIPSATGALTTTPDLYPTLLGLAKIEPLANQASDGVDLIDVLGGGDFERGPIFWHYPHYSNQGGTPGAGVREGDWKLIRFFEDGKESLFNLADDPAEHHDQRAHHPEIAQRLSTLLDDWSADVAALVPRRNSAGPRPWPQRRAD
nr:sulfatase [Demetria terragena]